MGKLDFVTKVSGKASALWRTFIKRSPLFIVLTGLTVVSVLGLGVGGTLAATGVIPNPFASSSSDELSPEDLEGSSDQSRPPRGDGKLPSEAGDWGAVGLCPPQEEECELSRRGNLLINSDWTGTVYNFTRSGYFSYTLVNVISPDNVTSKLEINGRLATSGTIHDCKPIAPERWPEDWDGHCSTMTDFPLVSKEFFRGYFDACRPGGDTYIVETSGGGFYFRESGIIPPEFFDCPAAVLTPSPSPESSSEPTSSPTPETSPTPEISSEPTSSPTPTP